jgi:ferritin-like metal-binding protein YciE
VVARGKKPPSIRTFIPSGKPSFLSGREPELLAGARYYGGMPITLASLHDLLVDELRDLHSAETQLVAALPKMAKAATNRELKRAFTHHLKETRQHVRRLARALKHLEASPNGKKCQAMAGLIKEGAEAIHARGPAAVRDANLIGAAQRVEHYEMAAYGTSRAFAEKLVQDDVGLLLQQTLDEEGAANKKLIEIAKTVNDDAFLATNKREVILETMQREGLTL